VKLKKKSLGKYSFWRINTFNT